MPYVATFAARQSQFGATVVEYNLVDSDGLLPPQRISIKLRTQTPTPRQLIDALAIGITNATASANDQIKRRSDEAAMRSRLSGFVEGKLEQLRVDYSAQIAASSLTADQKAIANSAQFDWRLA